MMVEVPEQQQQQQSQQSQPPLRQQAVPPQHSLYDASPTPSEEAGGGVSPVKTRLATRFFTNPSAAAVQAAVAAAASLAASAADLSSRTAGGSSSSNGGGASSSTSGPTVGPHSSRMQQLPLPAAGHLQDSIYGSSSSQVLQHRAASNKGSKGRQPHQLGQQQLAGSHTSLVDVQNMEGAQVSVELFVPHTGAHVKDTFWPCTFNLSKVIMGAGMMAIPKAFQLLGIVPGTLLMLLMACLSYFTLAGLVSATASTGAGSSYGALVRRTLGPRAEALLQLAVFANCYIMEVVFVVVLGDILIGTAPDFGGLLPEWFGVSPAHCVWLRRDVVLGATSLLVLLPLAAMRSMERLAVVNIIGVASNGVFAGLMLALAAGAAANGVLQPPSLWPVWSDLGSTPLLAAVAIATVVPVLLNCDVCHQSLHPLMPLLQPYSVSRMQRLVATALGICNSTYFTIIICSCLVFGSALEADVLANVNSTAMAPLIGPTAARLMAAIVRVGYLLSLVGSYVLLCYPLRQCLGDQFLPGGQAAVKKHWLLITTCIVLSASAIGCYLPSIWGALALVGATTSTVQAFIIPGLAILSVERTAAKAAKAARAAAANRGLSSSSTSRFLAQGQVQQEALQAPLLAAGSEEGDVESSEAGTAAAAATADGSFKVVRPPQPAWLCVLRQVVAALAVALGVGLFANSVLQALLDFIHPHAEGMALAAGWLGVQHNMHTTVGG